jgi:general secretion pathway protein B
MSYILEALKKAQAERQLGNAPTIHAPQPAPAAQPGAAPSRRPLLVGLGAGGLVVVAGALLMWHRAPGQGPAASAADAAAGAAVVQAGAPGAAGAPVVAGRTPASLSNRLEVSAPPAPPERPAHGPEAQSAAGRAGAASQGGTNAPASTAPPRTAAARAATPAAAPAATPAAAAAPAPEDSLPYLHQLPDAVQRDVPRVSFGGYMYSANPADRLLLVDKALRHEGEEVAPGLVLEKLLPKAAVMNYRGVRYRVAY